MKAIRTYIYIIAVAIVIVVAGLIADSCSRSNDVKLIGVSQCSNSEWSVKMNNEMQMMGYINDSIEICIKSTNGNSKMQAAQIDSLVEMGASLLVISPDQFGYVTPAIERAYDKGIPIVLCDRKINSNKYTAYIGIDSEQVGMQLMDYIADRLHGHGRVVEILGTKGAPLVMDRHRGFMEAMKKHPGMKVVDMEYADWTQAGAEKAMERVLRRTQDFDYVIAHNDIMAYGAYLAAKRSGVDMNKVKFAGVDGMMGTNSGAELVRHGILDASCLCPTSGNEVMQLVERILKHKPFRRENRLSSMVVTENNADFSVMTAQSMDKQRGILETLNHQKSKFEDYYDAQKMFAWSLCVFLLFVVVASVFLYQNYLAKKRLTVKLTKKNKDLRRLNDEVLEMTQSKLNFFTNVSHELRTPLSLIVDPVEQLFASEHLDKKERNLLKVIHRNTLALRQLVDDIMDFRKVQVGKMKLNLAHFNLSEKLCLWIDNFYPLVNRRSIELKVDIDKFTHNEVVADEDKLNRIVFNLIGNAIKYTSPGGKIMVTLADEPENMFRLSVKDTGTGLSEEDQSRVFDKFFQARNATGGTGIGLAMVKAYAEQHGGKATVSSKQGEGAEFTIIMPCTQDESIGAASGGDVGESMVISTTLSNVNIVSGQNAVSKIISDSDKPTVLIIDDNQDIRDYICDTLSDNYNIIEAGNGKNGLDMALRYVPDVVVSDVMMPLMGGIELCTELRRNAATCHIPIVLLTAKNLDEHIIEGYEHGADSYITKPFNSKVLKARIDNLMEKRRMLERLFKGNVQTDVSKVDIKEQDKDFITRLRSIIKDNLADADFGVEAIGQAMGLSRVQLYRKVKAIVGVSVVDLLRKARLQRGHALLEQTDKSIAEIAYEVGFSSPSYFTKCFKDEYDILPGDVRGKK